MQKRNAREILRALEKPTLEEEMERFLSMTPEQILKELEAAGYTLAELEAEEEALFGPVKGAAVTSPTSATPPLSTSSPQADPASPVSDSGRGDTRGTRSER